MTSLMLSTDTFSRTHLLEALTIFQQSAIYSHEQARTYYKLSELYHALDFPNKADDAGKTAEKLRKSLMKETWAPAQSEDDFDNLVTYISR